MLTHPLLHSTECPTAAIFYLGYVLSSTPRREYFQVTPDGFYFRKKVGRVAGAP